MKQAKTIEEQISWWKNGGHFNFDLYISYLLTKYKKK